MAGGGGLHGVAPPALDVFPGADMCMYCGGGCSVFRELSPVQRRSARVGITGEESQRGLGCCSAWGWPCWVQLGLDSLDSLPLPRAPALLAAIGALCFVTTF